MTVVQHSASACNANRLNHLKHWLFTMVPSILFADFNLSLPWLTAAAVGVSFASTLVLTPIACWFAHRLGVIDRPDGHRKLQRQPVALLGGVAVLAGLGITVLAAVAAGAMDNSHRAIALTSLGLSMLCAVGVVDDAFNIPAGWKLLAQIFSAIPITAAGGVLPAVDLVGYHIPLGSLGFLATLAWLVTCTNAINLIDGMDGLCSTVGLCIAAGITGVTLIGGSGNTMVCAAALAGALAGFLVFNLPPARIYLGDAGSMVTGMTLGILTLHTAQGASGAAKPIILAALMFVPMMDIALAVLRRSLSGRSIFHADRGHIHHRLLEHGLSVRQALLCIACICTTTSLIAIGIALKVSVVAGALALVLVTAILVNLRLVGHYEWTLVRQALSRRATAAVPEEPTSLRVFAPDGSTPVVYHGHRLRESTAAPETHRRAA